MKQTAVEWLMQQLKLNSKSKENSKGGISFKIGLSKIDELHYQAKAMEKEQIMGAYYQIGKDHQDMIFPIEKNAEQYYKETYESNN